jgi:hypothetical protein
MTGDMGHDFARAHCASGGMRPEKSRFAFAPHQPPVCCASISLLLLKRGNASDVTPAVSSNIISSKVRGYLQTIAEMSLREPGKSDSAILRTLQINRKSLAMSHLSSHLHHQIF